MKSFKILTAVILMLVINTAAFSQNAKATTQHKRIVNGVKSGELTTAEKRKLGQQQKDIRSDKREAKADGVVTYEEKAEIKKDRRKASRTIYRKKHNPKDRN